MRVPEQRRQAAVAVMLFLLAACGTSTSGLDKNGLPLGVVTVKFLEARFEGHLVYPGATLYRKIGHEEYRNEEGLDPALIGGIYLTADPPGKIYDWYRRELLPRGWTDYALPLAGPDASVMGYRRGDRESFAVAIENPDLLHDVIGGSVPPGQTIINVDYMIGLAPGRH